MKIDVSTGEVLDKISILQLKAHFIEDEERSKNVRNEMELLIESVSQEHLGRWLFDPIFNELVLVNKALWLIEDQIREKEAKQEFDKEFVELARSVYLVNDERAALKRKINEQTKSLLVEEKEYKDYSRIEDENTDTR